MKTIWLYFSLITLFLWPSFSLKGQPVYGNEWIVKDQRYLKFLVNEIGIYRITYEQLAEAGIPISQIAGKSLQLFSHGIEIPIRTTSPNVFEEGDFIEFYGQPNDGRIDGRLYQFPEAQQLNPNISLYNHARPYFLSWSEGEHLRYSQLSNGMDQGSLPPEEPYYIHREVIDFDDFHHKPSHDGRNFIRYSSMDYAEGYGSELANQRTISFHVDKLSSFGVNPRLMMRFGTNVHSSDWEIRSDSRPLQLAAQKGYGVVNIDERISLEELHEGLYDIHVGSIGSERARHTMARAELHYPRKYEFDNETFIHFHQQASILSRYIEVKGFGGKAPILYNLTNPAYIIPNQVGDHIQFVTAEAFTEQEWVLVDQYESVKLIDKLEEVSFNYDDHSASYVIISHKDLIASGAVQSYADYRASHEGGNYNVSVIDIEDLVNQYAYGISGHPLSIKNWIDKLNAQNELPEFVFIIGKGREYTDIKEGKVDHPVVPTFGIPGSDNLLLSLGEERYPVSPIGRLAAQSPEEILTYLEKISEHENPSSDLQRLEEQIWKKEIMHLSGGSAGNQATLYRFLNKMGEVITQNTFGANVSTYRKVTADPLERATTESIMDRIDKGLSILTFFGHSAVGTFDFSLEDPSKYDNQGRNPVILSLGCHSGNIHTKGRGISEDFVLEEGKGAIAFIASSGTAYPQPQFDTGKDFYDLLGGAMYGQPIGEVLRQSLMARAENKSLSVQTLVEQLTIHGDPAYKLPTFNGPDFIVENALITNSSGVLDATTQIFSVEFDIYNIGSYVDESVDVLIEHILPDGSVISEEVLTIPAPANSSHIILDLNNPGVAWNGANRIRISVDHQDQILEVPDGAAENNNEYIDNNGAIGLEFFVFDNSAKPVYPNQFGILPTAPFALRAAVNNGLEPNGTFVFQIDTTEHFNSNFFYEEVVDFQTSEVEWKPHIEAIPNRVYYWRIAPYEENDVLKSYNWQSSSFIYIPDSGPGWNQSHFFQFEKDDFYKIQISEDARSPVYQDRLWDVRIKNEIRAQGDFWVFVNNTPWASLNPREMGSLVSIFAWDKQDVLFKNSGDDFGSIPFSSDGFLYDIEDEEDLINIIELLKALPDGSRVFFHTMLESENADLRVDLWDDVLGGNEESLIDLLSSFGATKIRDITNLGTVPYTFIFDKNVGPVVEDLATRIEETIDLSTTARSLWADGTITSLPIPASGRWLRLLWEEKKEPTDDSQLFVLGVRPGGQRDTLKQVENDYSVNLTNINPEKYPYIALLYDTKDEVNKTAPELLYWRVLTTSLPDAAFDVSANQLSLRDTINAGEELELNFRISNFTELDMDPILIRYTLIDEDFNEYITINRAEKIYHQSSIDISEALATDQLSGNYRIIVELNPNEELPELTMCNNLGYSAFYVRPDKRNPFLDVTFDGTHIKDGELVSPTPEIVVSLSDEQSYLLLDDPDDFEITLYYPEVFRWLIDEESSAVEWLPATSLNDNRARFVIRPNLNVDGVYTLEVQAKDRAGNKAGNQSYRVRFTIDSSVGIPKLVVSPNPMIEYTDFEYYHDKDRAPDVFELLIYSSDGKLIKIVDQDDFGGIRKGVNRYRWYGVSDYGETLTTGIYYYEFVNNVDIRKNKQKGSVLKIR